jgi:hypothetical protein
MSKISNQQLPSVAFTRIGLLVGVPLAVVLGIQAVTWAITLPKTWSNGDLLDAAELNANFEALNEALESHHHDGRYASLAHNHDDRYASTTHNHDGRYALASHTHSYTLSCVNSTAGTANVTAGTSAQASSQACPAGYAVTGVTCGAQNHALRIVSTGIVQANNTGDCRAFNTSTTTYQLSATARCCRIQ